MDRYRVILVEDDPDTVELLRMALQAPDLEVRAFSTAEDAWFYLQGHPAVDVLIVDWMLPGSDGLALVQRIRRDPRLQQARILMLTARVTEDDVVHALSEGADDYLRKPFSLRELKARLRALLRRNATQVRVHWIRSGRLRLSPELREAYLDDVPLSLTPREFDLLLLLVQERPRVLHRDTILRHLGMEDATRRTVDVHIRNLRKKLGAYGRWIETRRGAGYRWREPD